MSDKHVPAFWFQSVSPGSGVVFMQPGVKVNGAYYCDVLLLIMLQRVEEHGIGGICSCVAHNVFVLPHIHYNLCKNSCVLCIIFSMRPINLIVSCCLFCVTCDGVCPSYNN